MFILPSAGMHVMPLSIALLSSLLKENGFTVELFEACYKEGVNIDAACSGRYAPQLMGPLNIKGNVNGLQHTPAYHLKQKIDMFQPDLIAVMIVESAFFFVNHLLNEIQHYNIPTIAGGVFPTFAPEKVFENPAVDMICIGEGEILLPELCKRMQNRQNIDDLPNLWVKTRGMVRKNPVGPVVDIDHLPLPDYSIFTHPTQDMSKKLIPFETNRGCLYSCTYCNSPSMSKLYLTKRRCHFFRKRSIASMERELDFIVTHQSTACLYFISDTFLAWNDQEFDEFIELYSRYKIPFFCNTNPDTITDHRMDKLKSIGLSFMAIGVQHGNEQFRKKILNRNVTNREITHAFDITNDFAVMTSAENIVGFPMETLELAFDTICLNEKIHAHIKKCYIFKPYHGTPLRDLSVALGYLNPEIMAGSLTQDSILNMAQFPIARIKTTSQGFNRFVRSPEQYFTAMAA